MTEEKLSAVLDQLPGHSRVWIYAADRPLSSEEAETTRTISQRFAQQWVSHNQQLRSAADLLHNRFLVLAVDQSQAGASGCSIDSSVHFVQRLGSELGVDFFNRMVFHYRDAVGQVQTAGRESFQAAYQQSNITDETTVFDPLVDNLDKLRTQFEKPLRDSWHARMV